MKVLLLGSYGLIGRHVAAELTRSGYRVVGVGRSPEAARRVHPEMAFVPVDLAAMDRPGCWYPLLEDVDAVVNASGALQSGARDDLRAVQCTAITTLVEACVAQGVHRFVQISAPGASDGAETDFLRTKALADAALKRSPLAWTVLRPGLVIAPEAFGGTALLRAVAASPGILFVSHADARVQCVDVAAVAGAVTRCLRDGSLAQGDFDLVEPQARALRDCVALLRRWLGIPPARALLEVPRPVSAGLARLGDLAAWLGWRPALRTTALRVLSKNVLGDPRPWREATGEILDDLPAILAARPSTRQDRAIARLGLMFPLLLFSLAALWLGSGAVVLMDPGPAARLLEGVMSGAMAMRLTVAGAVADVLLGLALCVRPWLGPALLCSLALGTTYLVAGTLLTPGLWLDPLAPLLKILPALGLTLVVWILGEER